MKNIKNKGIAGILSAVLIIVGVFLIGTPGKALANENIPNVDKFLTVKWQMSNNSYKLENGTNAKNLRIVTTIDAEKDVKYGKVGFYITFLADDDEKIEMHHKVSVVSHRISANSYEETYDYGPKAFHATSEWFATCTITGIPENYWDNGIVIKPYVTVKGNSTPIYGQHRYLTMKDQENNVITIPVKGELDITGIEPNDYATFDRIHKQDGFTHVRLQVSDLKSLPSISEYTVTYVGGSQEVKYRYLLAGAEDCGDTVTDHSWYTMSEGDNKVIVTPSEMRSFVALSKTSADGGRDFAGETIYLGADITLDKSTVWNIIGATNNSETYGKYFAGHFDGNMHTIAGVTVNKAQGYVYGLFGEVKGENAIVENFILSNSSFTINTEKINTYSGCVVGSLNQGTVRNVKCDSTVKLTIGKKDNHYNGGLVGRAIDGVIENCWFAGRIEGTGTYQGGILGGLYNSGATCTIEQCLFTGNIKLNEYTGGICGDVRSDGAVVNTLTIRDTLYVGDMSGGDGKYYKGLFIGNVASSGNVVADNLYGHNTTFGTNVKNIGWADSTGANANRTIDAKVTHLARAAFNGATGYLNIDLDYYVPEDHEDGTWVIVEGEAPHLKVFGDTAGEQYIDIRTIGEGTNDARTVWYKATDDKAETFILYSPADFRGFQELSLTNGFAPGGVQDTVKLGADINHNPTTWKAEQSPEEAPNKWTPIGDFAGIFDGDMHTVSGIYLRVDQGNTAIFSKVTGTVQKLIVENSYIENTGKGASTGSIVGELSGNLDTVKSSAYVVLNGSEYAGGLVGKISGSTGGRITNCWFAGSVSGEGGHHGTLLGGITSSNSNGYIEHCLSTGTIDYNSKRGGLVGSLWTETSYLEIKDSLFAGSFVGSIASPNNLSNTYAQVNKGRIEIQDVYIMRETRVSTDLGGKTNNGTAVTNNFARVKAEKLYLGAARENTTLSICEEADYGNPEVVGETKFWYISEKHPILASFGEPVKDYELKVATYNIGYGRKNGEDEAIERQVLEEVGLYIKNSNFDICLLQEVDEERTLPKLREQLPENEYYIGYRQAHYSPKWHSIGLAIVSKYKIVNLEFKPISVSCGGEGRGLLEATIDVNNDNKADVTIICAHFCDGQEEIEVQDRNAGVTLLKSIVQDIKDKTPNMPIVFGGDLNQAYINDKETPHIKDINEFLVSITAGVGGLHTAHTPSYEWYQLDYIFTNDQVGQGSYKVETRYMTDGTTELSDHRPLIATLYIKAQ